MNIPQQNHILVGLGGTGGKVLKAFKKRLFQEFTPEERAKLPIGFLYVDTIDEMMRPRDKSWYVLEKKQRLETDPEDKTKEKLVFYVELGNAQFNANEFLFIKGIPLEQVFASPSSFPGLKGVVGDPEVMQKSIGTLGEAAGQMRRAGRILFGANVSPYRTAMENVYKRVQSVSKASCTCIYIFGGLAGGTGSGSIVDVIAQTRKIPAFQEEYHSLGNGRAGTNIVAYTMIPEIAPPGRSDEVRYYHANGYAALTELNGLLTGAWKPFDLTSMSPTGRLEFEGIPKIADGLMVYTNENEKGVTLDSHHELPQIVADFVYSKIFLEFNDRTTTPFIRSTTFETITEYNEMYEKAKNGAIVPYRTKGVGAFGIKRIVYPEEEIKAFLICRLSRQALLQLRYNNWNDVLGFRDAPANIDWNDYVKGQDKKMGSPLENWKFSDKHLMLDIPVLPSDEGKWGTFTAYWNKVVPKWLEDAQSTQQPIAKLNELCAKGLQSGFRGAGVTDFFAGKKEAREKHADEIVQRMEADLFDKWASGTFSLFNLLELSDAIQAEIRSKIKQFEDWAVKLRQLLDKLEQERQAKAQEYNDAGLITRVLRGKQMLAGYSEIMQKICLRRTEVEGVSFAIDLLKVLAGKENQLQHRMESFVSTVNDSIKETEQQVGALCKDEVNTDDLEGPVLRYYDRAKVIEFLQSIILNKEHNESISTAVRQEILRHIGTEKTFGHANAAIDQDVLNDILNTVCNKVMSIHDETLVESREQLINRNNLEHDETLVESREKLFNRNILELLSEKYTSAEYLQAFARKIISESGVLVRFNPDEVSRSVANNPVTQVGTTVLRRIVLVNMPKLEGNEKVHKFAEDFKVALENATGASISVHVGMSGNRINEITVMSLAYYFPLRCLQNLTFYKEKFDYLTTETATMSASEVQKNKVILFGEGTGGEGLPSLFLAPEKQKSQLRKEYMSWIMLAYAGGLIKYSDILDGTGRNAYGTVEVDEVLGLESLQPLAFKFSEIGRSERFTEDFCEDIKAQVEKLFSEKYLHVENRISELHPKIQELLNGTLLPETGNNPGSQEFLEFVAAAEHAIEIIQQ